MRKLLYCLLLSLLVACTESASSPIISVTGVYLNEDQRDYSRNVSSLPPLNLGDEIIISLKLEGNGEHLNTFLVQEEKEDGAASLLSLDFDELEEEDLSEDKEFTDKQRGLLGFKDGVEKTTLKVRAIVQRIYTDEVELDLYLFSKAIDCEGAKLEVDFTISKELLQ